MTVARRNGQQGESIVAALLQYEGWEIIERQAPVHGHRLDFRAKHLDHGEALFEVKVWGARGGKDTVKKALSDAYDLRECGETTPYILVLSHHLTGEYRDQILRAVKAGVIREVRVLGFLPLAQALPALPPREES